jgi:hypothetical protein
MIRASHDHHLVATSHLRTLCDDTAVLQHADGVVPRAEDGYCVDDAGRLLPVAGALAEGPGGATWLEPIARCLTMLRAATSDGGMMRNFLSWDRRWLDQPHDGDHAGRAVWGLGELAAQGGQFADDAARLAERIAPGALRDAHVRPMIYATLGIGAASSTAQELWSVARQRVTALAERCRLDSQWPWPESRLSYDNARLPEAMVVVGTRDGNDRLIDVGLGVAEWLFTLSTEHGFVRVAGHRGLEPDESIAASGDEQPLEVAALLDLAVRCAAITGAPIWRERASRCWSWFVGINRCATPMVGLVDGRCADGLGADGPSRNSGAESTIAFHRSCLVWQSLLGDLDLETPAESASVSTPAWR